MIHVSYVILVVSETSMMIAVGTILQNPHHLSIIVKSWERYCNESQVACYTELIVS